MPDGGAPRQLRLREALIEWCEPSLVEAVCAEERLHTAYEMRSFRRGRLTSPEESRAARAREWYVNGDDFSKLIDAWKALERDLARRLEDAELFLTGVKLRPELTTEPQPIPGAWAADFNFDFHASVVVIRNMRFGSVTVSRTRPAAAPGPTTVAAGLSRAEITANNARDLTDDEVLVLLEDHARRVIEGPDAPLIAPGKISLLPIIRGKMQHRAERGELLPTLSAESRWLADWIASKLTWHHLPTSKTIGKVLSSDYGVLKTRSNAAITRSGS
jgi:hypothetical protein